MGIIQNIGMNRKRKADARVIEKIKKLQDPVEIFSAVQSLELEESVMQVFHLFDENHIYDKFKSGRYEDIATFLENPAEIFDCLKEEDNRYEIFRYLYENGMTHECFQYCFRQPSEKYFFNYIKDQTHQEDMLEQLYDGGNLSDQLVLSILFRMNPEKRDKFIGEHTLNEAVRLQIDRQLYGRIWVDKTDNEISDLLAADEVNDDLYKISHEQAREFLDKFGKEMSSSNLEHCISEGYLDGKAMEVLPLYKNNMNADDLNSLFERIAFDYRNMYLLIEQYAGEMQENTLMEIFKRYNTAVHNAKIMQNREEDNEDKIPFSKHAEEEPHFLYHMAKLYYDKKLGDKQFEAKDVNKVIQELPVLDQLKFASEYKEKIPMIAVKKIEEAMANSEEQLDTKDILVNYQGILSRDSIVALINAQPFEDKMELVKSCNLSKEEKDAVIAFAKKQNKGASVSFLELATSVAELERKNNVEEENNFPQKQSSQTNFREL